MKTFKASYAPNTHKAYGQAATRFTAFLHAEAERGLSPASLSIVSAAIGAAAKAAGVDDPRGPLSSRALGDLKRKHRDRGRGQVAGLKREDVEAAARLAAVEATTAGLRDAALLRLGSDGFLRISELAAVRVEHLEAAQDGSGCLRVPRSKTDQDGEGETLYVCKATMAAIVLWRNAAGIPSGPLFRRVSKGSVVSGTALSESGIRKIIQQRARAAGFQGRVSGHSLRVGSAQSLVARGASTAELMQAGRWKDPKTATRYAANELAASGAVARFFEDGDG